MSYMNEFVATGISGDGEKKKRKSDSTPLQQSEAVKSNILQKTMNDPFLVTKPILQSIQDVPSKIDQEQGKRLAELDGYAERNRYSYQSSDSAYDNESDKIYQYFNEWISIPGNRELSEAVRRLDNTRGMYTDEQLKAATGYTQLQVDTARIYTRAYDTLPTGYTFGRRISDTVAGTLDDIGGSALMLAGSVPQAAEDYVANVQNQDYQESVAQLHEFDNLDQDILSESAAYEEALQQYDQVAQSNVPNNSLYNWGAYSYQRGQDFLDDAMLGETDEQKFLHKAVAGAIESLMLGAANPASALYVPSIQDAGKSLSKSYSTEEGASVALSRAALKALGSYELSASDANWLPDGWLKELADPAFKFGGSVLDTMIQDAANDTKNEIINNWVNYSINHSR
jgi:hypothetical protein